jgi:hypothetical protein
MKVFFIGLVLFQSVILDVLLVRPYPQIRLLILDASGGVDSSMRILFGVSS